jgi:DNA-binding transcriptional LysR family regulator
MLDPDLLRSFLAVVDTGSFTRAATSVHLSQSTVSQQIRRLELQLACELLDRSGRYVVTTPEGERLLGYARRIVGLISEAEEQLTLSVGEGVIRLGVPEDFAAHTLTPMLASFAIAYPGLRLEVTSGLSHELWQAFQDGVLDVALVKQRIGSSAGRISWPEPLAWIDSREHPTAMRDPVPLVVFPSGGLYRNEMTLALDASGRRWRIAFVSASLASISAAVEDGLGLSLLPRRLATPGHRLLEAAEGFSPVPDLELTLHAKGDLPAHGKALVERLVEVCHQVMRA